jgi:cytochrome c oxidase subunit II
MRLAGYTTIVLVVLLAGCGGQQSALDPRGPVAGAIASLWWLMFWGALAILALVMSLLLYAMFRRGERIVALPETPFLIGAGLLFPATVLTALLVLGTWVGRSITESAVDPLLIEVTGHQWWWEVRYFARDALPEIRVANELHLPVGVPVHLSIKSSDVIHSFWIPSLGGKVDMIPGRTNVLRLRADSPGRFRGQCSEFCGAGHSRMSFTAVAESQEAFAQWWRSRAAIPVAAASPGLETFLDRNCGDCHSIAGTAADGAGGPVLTHFADRPTLGGATLPNTPATLRAWLADHGKTLKPGSHGPQQRDLADEDVEVIAIFLQHLR